MSIRAGRRLQCAAACGLVVAYAGLTHYCNTAGVPGWGAALALTPLCLIAVLGLWRSTTPPVAILACLTLAGGLLALWPLLERHFPLVSLLQETGLYSLLGGTFSRSLMGRRTAVCTGLADRVHGPLSRREVLYTRRVTLAWAIFFFAIAAASIVLYVTAPLRVWSLYTNFCVVPLIAAMFLGEFLVRRRVLPEIRRAGLAATVRIYFASDS